MITKIFFLLAIVCSLGTQLPQMLETEGGGPLKLVWVPVGLMVLWTARKTDMFANTKAFTIFVFIFTTYLFLLTAFTQTPYFGADFTNIMISYLICIVSYGFWARYRSPRLLNVLAWTVFICGILFSYELYIYSLQDMSIESRYEIYASKNSAAQIILGCGVVGLICIQKNSKLSNAIVAVGVVAMSVIVFILRSRATLVSYFAILTYLVFTSPKKWHRVVLLGVCVAAVVYVLITPEYYTLIVENILFNNRESGNMDDLSSGRVEIISGIWEDYQKSPMFGLGNLYVDCMPFAMLVQYGVPGFLIVMTFLAYVLKISWDCRKMGRVGECSFLLVSSFMVNSLFEAQPPFGPGVKCFFVWMFFGFMLAVRAKQQKINENLLKKKELCQACV